MKFRTPRKNLKCVTGNAAPSRLNPLRLNPLRLDPSRTTTLRRAFATQINLAFGLLKGAVVKLVVDDDVFGLQRRSHALLSNVFCATGDGGGVDPTCSKDRNIASEKAAKWLIRWRGTPGSKTLPKQLPDLDAARVMWESRPKVPVRLGRWEREDHDPSKADMGKIPVQSWTSDLETAKETVALMNETHDADVMAGRVPKNSRYKYLEKTFQPHEILVDLDNLPKDVDAHARRLAGEPDSLSEVLVYKHALATNTAWQFTSDPDRIKEFQEWLRGQFGKYLLGRTEEELWRAYVLAGFKKGQSRAFEDWLSRNPAEASALLSTSPDFMGGAKEQFLRESFAQPVSVDKVKLLAGRTFDELKNVTHDMSTKMTRALADGLAQGKSPRDVARDLNKQVDIGKDRALLVARSELARAHSEGQLTALKKLGVEELGVMVEWSTSGLGVTKAGYSSPCSLCAPLQGIVVKIDEASGMIPRHPNCVTGDSVVTADDALAVMKTHFTGEIVELVTAEGRRLTVTPNHMLLTDRGFLPARFAYDGLNVLKAPRPDDDAVEAPDDDAHEACIADVFTSLAERPLMLSKRMELAPENLHGDGASCDPEVHVVFPHRELWDHGKAGGGSEVGEDAFEPIQFLPAASPLPRLSAVAQFLERVALAADGSMGRFRESLAILLGHALRSQRLGVLAVSGLNASVVQSLVDGVAAAPEAFRECVRAHPALKQFHNLSGVELQAVLHRYATGVLLFGDVDPEAPEPSGDGVLVGAGAFGEFSGGDAFVEESHQVAVQRGSACGEAVALAGGRIKHYPGPPQTDSDGRLIDPELFRHLRGRDAGPVQFDKVVGIQVRHVSNLPVYDVTTHTSLYRVNGLITSNCMCVWVPAGVGESTKGQKTGAPAIRAAILRSKGKGSWAAGKRISTRRPRSILNNALLLNSFCATGPGGGIDPTCGKGDASPPSVAHSEQRLRELVHKNWADLPDFHAADFHARVAEREQEVHAVLAEIAAAHTPKELVALARAVAPAGKVRFPKQAMPALESKILGLLSMLKRQVV